MSSTESPFKPSVLQGRVALVTGGTSGIGLEIARQLGVHGARVAVTGRRQAVLDAACADLSKSGVEVVGLQGDVRSSDLCESIVKQVVGKWGGLDILVNCAAGNFLAAAEELTSNGFKTVMEIDALGTFNMSRAAHPALLKSSAPSIVNISATLHYGATWYQVHASAAKAAVDSMTRTMALEWGQDGIRVNGIAPGPIEGTAGMAKLAPSSNTSGSSIALDVVSAIPLGRMGKKWDIAMAAVFLSSSGASFITGDVLVVDGANWMYRQPIVPRSFVSKASRGVESSSRKVGVVSKL